MIPLNLPATAEAEQPFIARLTRSRREASDTALIYADEGGAVYASDRGLISVEGASAEELEGDVVLVRPGTVERLIRARSRHNTLLVTERCDQLCQMCSQPPKKTHVDRFAFLREACLLAPENMLIGITGGEPTLYKQQLFELIESVVAARPDLEFHVLSNAQHFEAEDSQRLRSPAYRRVSWGIPLYAATADLHDNIVGKAGAYVRLRQSFAVLLCAGARIELRTVVTTANAAELARLAALVATQLRFIETWSIMQLENIGFARRRWTALLYDHVRNFEPVATALDQATLHGIHAQLFNFPLCTVPPSHRRFAVPSISDWKRKLATACETCTAASECSGFFEWHPDADAEAWAVPL